MYDKQVRRRRLTQAAFVIASLLLLTVYFGEGSGGGLHSAQRGTLSFLGPVQEGAHRALKPVRDLFGWVGDTVDAKKERDKLKKENQDLNKQVAELQSQSTTNKQLKSLLQINDTGLDDLAPVPSLVISRSSSVYGSHVVIDKGSSAGVRLNQPVVNGDGLVGRISKVGRGFSQVTLITDESFGTGVKVLGSGQQTAIGPDPNRPGQLQLKYVQNVDKISRGDQVVASGSTDLKLQSLYPRDVLIGTVSKIEAGDGNLDSRVQVKPAVDLGTLEWVEVLTKHQAPQTVASTVAP
jgi:rod shape-determining protein MreC